MYTPGHTDDSYSFRMADRVFTGDTLLIRGTGRTDFQNGDPRAQYELLFNRLLRLPDETLVFPAHDYKGDTVSTIGEEKRYNPRLQVRRRDEYATLMNELNLSNPKMMDVAVPANMHQGLHQEDDRAHGWAISAEQAKPLIGRPDIVLIDLREKKRARADWRYSRFAACALSATSHENYRRGRHAARAGDATGQDGCCSIARSASARRWPCRRRRIRASPQPGTSMAACRPGRRRAARRIDLGGGLSLSLTSTPSLRIRRGVGALRGEVFMPKVKVNDITINYESQGSGEPLILIPYLAADNACYAFQVADYAKHFTCISLDPRGAGESDKSDGPYSTELFADDVAAFMKAIGVEKAHVSGLSLGGAIGLWLAAKHPERVKTLSLHSCWPKTDPFLKVVVGDWQTIAKALDSVPEMIIQGIFPFCFTPELYAAKPEYIDQLAAFVRSRPKQPVDAFLRQSDAVIAHDALGQLSRITAPTLITFGQHDIVTSTRFVEPLTSGIKNSELVIFEMCAHAPIYERVSEFNEKTLAFLKRHAG